MQDSKKFHGERKDGVFLWDGDEEKYELNEVLDTTAIESSIISDIAI